MSSRMINPRLISPKSIAVIGGSENLHKPGGSVLNNLINTSFSGEIYVVNPKYDTVRGLRCYRHITDLPQVDLAILAIPAEECPEATDILCNKKECGAIIILSAGFGEDSPHGALLEKEIVEIADRAGTTIIGPNCLGVITPAYAGAFFQPIPRLSPKAVDFISSSGTTIVYTIEMAHRYGLRFSNVFSVGNSAQVGVEDILEYLDETYDPATSSPVKMLYIESISDPEKFLKHSSSLIRKGARICAIKSGYSEAGSRAATSHTGAMSTPDKAISALFRKAGIIRCYSRTELTGMATAMMIKVPEGRRMAIITNAGGPAVMLTDTYAENGIVVPQFTGPKAEALEKKLYPGASVNNPIDILSTGTAEQVGEVIDACQNDFDVDAVTVILGKVGLQTSTGAYRVIAEKIKTSKKPIYPILTSILSRRDEIDEYHAHGGLSFPDEVIFGQIFAKLTNRPEPIGPAVLPPVDRRMIRNIIDNNGDGYLPVEDALRLLDAAGITRVPVEFAKSREEVLAGARVIGWPLVMKVVGPIHKSEIGGVALNIRDEEHLCDEFDRLMRFDGVTSVMLQPSLSGVHIFIGAQRYHKFGHLVMCGMGGVYVQVIKDISYCLSPVSQVEATEMIHRMRAYRMLHNARGHEGINETVFNEMVRRVSALCKAAPEIYEMDINPLIGNSEGLVAVNVRIRIEKKDVPET